MPAALTVATLNTAGLPNSLRPFRERAFELGRWAEASPVDVLNLQEVWTAALLRILRPHLPSYPHVGLRRRAGQPAGGLVIFSRRPLAEVRYTSYRGARAGGGRRFRARQWLNTRLQGVLVARVPSAGAVVGNTHLTANRDGDWSVDNRHYPMQRRQLALMHAALPPTADLTILCGDFNTAASGPLYPAVVGDYRDPFATLDPPTFQAALLESTRRPHRIDYLLVRGDAERYPVRSATTFFADPVPGFGLVSDHVGLVAEIALPAPPSSPPPSSPPSSPIKDLYP